MKLTFAQLDKHLAAGKLAPAYVVTGEQDLLRELATESIRRVALGDADEAFNLDRLDGEKLSSGEVVMSANTMPLMAMTGGRRVVLVRRAKRMVEGSQAEALIGYLEDPAPQTLLLLELESPPDGRRKAWKQIEKRATVVQCDPLKDGQVADWIAEQARAKNLSLGQVEVRYLAGEFGSDLRRQLSELEKLALYASGEAINTTDLTSVLGRGKAQSVFRFTDAVAARQSSAALKQLGRLMEEGEPPLRVLALLDRVIGQLLVAKELERRRARSNELMKVLRVPPRAAENLARWSRHFDEEELMDAIEGLAWCDHQLKTSGTPPQLVLEGLVVLVCGAERKVG